MMQPRHLPKYIILPLLALLFLHLSANAQVIKKRQSNQELPPEVEEWLENLAADNDDADVDYDTFAEILYDIMDDPLDLNTVDEEDLNNLNPLLSPQQIKSIIAYREEMDGFTHIYELAGVDGIDEDTARRLANFLTIKRASRKIPIKEILFQGKHQIFARYQQILEKQAAYIPDTAGNTAFLGPSYRAYFRYRYNYGTKFSYGLTAEKDPGEEFFTGTQKQGFDFYSAHLFIRKAGIFKNIIIGDYIVQLGQGLTVASSLGLRKGSTYPLNIMRRVVPVRPYTSVDENRFFRGATASVELGNISATGFASFNFVDANVTALVNQADSIEIDEITFTPDDVDEISSLQTAGMHRTASELSDKRSIGKLDVGGNISYRSSRFSIGLNTIYTRLSAELARTNPSPDDIYAFNGNQLLNLSTDYRFLLHHSTFFGETAWSNNGGVSTLNGFITEVNKYVSLSILHRYYSPKYQSLHANAFGEGSGRGVNEQGVYIGMVVNPIPKWQLTAYFDAYRHPWLRFRADAPSYGTDMRGELMYKPMRRVQMYWRFRHETKKQNASSGNGDIATYLTDYTNSALRYNLKTELGRSGITLQSRVEVSRYDDSQQPSEYGYLLMQDIAYRPDNDKFPVDIIGRIAFFDTPSYNSRIYAYENDVLYAFSVPAYFNQGIRYYGMLKWDANRHLSLWLRYAQTYQNNPSDFGSGNSLIEGQTKSEIKVMMRLKF